LPDDPEEHFPMTTSFAEPEVAPPPVNGHPRPDAADLSTELQLPRQRMFRRAPAPLTGETRRVRKLRKKLAEHTAISTFMNDRNWTEADTPRVLTERSKAAEAAKLQRLLHDTNRRALSTARWRTAITYAAGAGLVLSLFVSTANVQGTVAGGAPEGSGKWWFAWTVEPAIALLMLSLFAFQAFMATRGVHVDDPAVKRTEKALLATTFVLNTWRHLPLVADRFDFVELVSHGVWPLLAVLIVTCVPRMWAYFGYLDHGGLLPADPHLRDKLEVARQWIAEGVLPVSPGRAELERTYRRHGIKVGTGMVQRVHRCLTGRTELL